MNEQESISSNDFIKSFLFSSFSDFFSFFSSFSSCFSLFSLTLLSLLGDIIDEVLIFDTINGWIIFSLDDELFDLISNFWESSLIKVSLLSIFYIKNLVEGFISMLLNKVN